jgi:integrase
VSFNKLLTHIPAYLRPLMIFLYTTGCRIGAAAQITWDMVSKDGRSIMLPANIVKNKTSKMFRKSGQSVFDVTNLRNEWDAVTTAFGRSELPVHDLPRFGVRNLTDSGVQERVAMSTSGHKTRSVFDRYNIVAPKQLLDAMEKVQRAAAISRAAVIK